MVRTVEETANANAKLNGIESRARVGPSVVYVSISSPLRLSFASSLSKIPKNMSHGVSIHLSDPAMRLRLGSSPPHGLVYVNLPLAMSTSVT